MEQPKRLMEKRAREGDDSAVPSTDGSPVLPKRQKSVDGTAPPPSRAHNHVNRQVSLHELSWPPSSEELSAYVDVPIERLPKKYKRDLPNRVFVNRGLSLEKIQYFGFDMDYTLAQYNSAKSEALAYRLTIERLVDIGYPREILAFKYDPDFPIRGLFFDKNLGNLLKVDSFGNILMGMHGKTTLSNADIQAIYPSKFVQADDIGRRYYVLNTLFNLPETSLYADLVDFFDNHENYTRSNTGVHTTDLFLSYKNIFLDVRQSIDWVHQEGTLKATMIQDLPTYVMKDARLPTLLDRMAKSGRKVFLATNSNYEYTERIMTYLFDFPHGPDGGASGPTPHRNWRTYFDIVIVDAQKPLFFAEGSILREVDESTKSLKIGSVTGGFQKGKIYSGGSSEIFCKLTGAAGENILYIGDHIFGDILKSKKEQGWRTFLVVPELTAELQIWQKTRAMYDHLENLQFMLAETYRGLDSHVIQAPDLSDLRKHILESVKTLNEAFNKHFGSVFRSGSRQTFFAMQAKRYADLYAGSFINLIHYPFFYDFVAPDELMPHEAAIMRGD